MPEKRNERIENLPSEKTVLFRDFSREQYLPFAREHKRSWKTDERYLKHHILPYLGAYPLEDISGEVLRDWIKTLEHSGLTKASCYRIFWLTKYILNCAVRWRVLASDRSFKDVVVTKENFHRPGQLSTEEALKLVRIIKDYPDRASAQAIHLLLLTGASKSEILNARWEDIDFTRRVLITEKTFTGRHRLIPLNDEAIKLIRSLPRREDVPWLFCSASGNRLVSVYYTWNLLRTRLGRPDLRLQDLRHAFAGFLVNMGIHQTEILHIMGHYMPQTLAMVQNHATVNRETA